VRCGGASCRELAERRREERGLLRGPHVVGQERRLHGALWGAYALGADWRFLLADVLFGAGNWISKH